MRFDGSLVATTEPAPVAAGVAVVSLVGVTAGLAGVCSVAGAL